MSMVGLLWNTDLEDFLSRFTFETSPDDMGVEFVASLGIKTANVVSKSLIKPSEEDPTLAILEEKEFFFFLEGLVL